MSARISLCFVAGVALLCACRGEVTDRPPVLVERDMFAQPRYEPQGYSRFFLDHAVMRTPVASTVPIEDAIDDDEVTTGVLAVPASVIDGAGGLEALAKRGRARFDVYCAVCHGVAGDGKGAINRFEGFPPIPTLHDDHVRHIPDGQLFVTIGNGVRTMPPYGAQIDVADRWAIVAYVRALELHALTPGGGS